MKMYSSRVAAAVFGALVMTSPMLAFADMTSMESQVLTLLAQVRRLKINIDAQGQAAAAAVAIPSTSTSISTERRRAFMRNLQPGMAGTDVQVLQDTLKDLRLMHGTSTGYYGPRTQEAVGKLQHMIGLPPTITNGHFGPVTRSYLQYNSLERQLGKPPMPASSTFSTTTSSF